MHPRLVGQWIHRNDFVDSRFHPRARLELESRSNCHHVFSREMDEALLLGQPSQSTFGGGGLSAVDFRSEYRDGKQRHCRRRHHAESRARVPSHSVAGRSNASGLCEVRNDIWIYRNERSVGMGKPRHANGFMDRAYFRFCLFRAVQHVQGFARYDLFGRLCGGRECWSRSATRAAQHNLFVGRERVEPRGANHGRSNGCNARVHIWIFIRQSCAG